MNCDTRTHSLTYTSTCMHTRIWNEVKMAHLAFCWPNMSGSTTLALKPRLGFHRAFRVLFVVHHSHPQEINEKSNLRKTEIEIESRNEQEKTEFVESA